MGEGQRDCENNAFCGKLDPELRRELCKRCVKTTLAANSSVSLNHESFVLPLRGLCCMTGGDRVISILPQGDFAFSPSLDPESWREFEGYSVNKSVERKYLESSRLAAITNTECAMFREEYVRELWVNSDFTRALLANWLRGIQHLILFDLEIYRADAYHAVRYTLMFARSQGLRGLTHAQIAFLTGLGRSTVTRVMQELTIAEPDLFEHIGE